MAQTDAGEGWGHRESLYNLGVGFVPVVENLKRVIGYNHAVGPQAGGGFDFQVGATVNVTAQNFAFDPSTFTVSNHTFTATVVTNRDAVLHTFKIGRASCRERV